MDLPATEHFDSRMRENIQGDAEALLQGGETDSSEHKLSLQTNKEHENDSSHPSDVFMRHTHVQGKLDSVEMKNESAKHSAQQVSSVKLAEEDVMLPSEKHISPSRKTLSTRSRGQHVDSLHQQPKPEHVYTLGRVGTELLVNFSQHGGVYTLQGAIMCLRQAYRYIPEEHESRGDILNNLAIALWSYYDQAGDINVLQQSAQLHREALSLCSQGHPNHGALLNNLASALMTLYKQAGDIDALQESIQLHRKALSLFPQGRPDRAISLNNLVSALMRHYEQTGDVDALTEIIQLLHEALSLHPQGHPDRGSLLNNLANALMTHFEQTGDMDALTETMQLHREALSLHPQGHPHRSTSLNNLANALMKHYEQTGGVNELVETMQLHREALSLHPHGHPDRGMSLNNLASALMTHYEQVGNVDVLVEIMQLHHEALSLHPQGHPDRSMSLVNLAHVIMTCYEQTGDEGALAEMIQLLREALSLCPQGHPNRGSSLNNLASALMTRYQKTGDVDALAESTKLHREALSQRPQGHPNHGSSLNNLANTLMIYFEQAGDIGALQESTQLHREALSLHQKGHPDHSMSLNNLANALMTYYGQTGDMAALIETIQLYQEALSLRPQGHPNRDMSLNNLASALMTHYTQTGDVDALAETIQLHREALFLRPQGHLERASSLNNLANALGIRYEQAGDIDALQESTQLHREALSLYPQGHPGRGMSLSNLADALMAHYRQARDVDALAETIQLHYEALSLCPQGHPNRGNSLNHLADALMAHHVQAGDVDALLEAMELLHEALSLHAQGHPNRASSLSNLARSYKAQFDRNGDMNALLTSLRLWNEVLSAWPHGHPNRHTVHHYIARWKLSDSPHFNWAEALNHLMEATTDSTASPRSRLRLATQSLHQLELVSFHQSEEYSFSKPALDVYLAAIQLLPHVAHAGLDLSHRLQELSVSEQLCRAAAARAMLLQCLPLAIEVFEEGKAVFWLQALRLRSTELDTLPATDRVKLLHLFQSLEQDRSSLTGDIHDKAHTERWIEHRRQLSMQADDFIEAIRLRPGFDRFLKMPPFEQLTKAAMDGYVVALIASPFGFFAIIIHASNPPQQVLLPSLNIDVLDKLCDKVSGLEMRNYGYSSSAKGPNTERGIMKEKSRAYSPLETMWSTIVKPIIDHLGLQRSQGQQRPRIHWYPSGNLALLPLHAAGVYNGKTQVCVADFAVSSYTPSLSAVIKSREGFTPIPREDLQVLVFGESGPPDLPHIPSVGEEVQTVAGLLMSTSASITNNVDSVPTVEEVLDRLPAAHILHLACHGQQDSDPLQSCFVLRDGPVTISALMKVSLPKAVLAFLSACETAKGDKKQPDQAVHLAASMLFCGFRSVIATMWSMYDKDGPKVAEWFYEALLEKETIDLHDIPYALDEAVQKLRATGAGPDRWATYIHVGA